MTDATPRKRRTNKSVVNASAAHARSKRRRSGNIPKALREARITRALKLLSSTSARNAKTTLMKEFDLRSSMASKVLHDAWLLMAEFSEKERKDSLALILHQIEARINGTALKSPVGISALKLKMDVLGLAAPTKIEATTIPPPFDHAATAELQDPAVRRAAMRLEELRKGSNDNGNGNGDTTHLTPIDAGTPSNPWLGVPAASADNPTTVLGYTLFPRS